MLISAKGARLLHLIQRLTTVKLSSLMLLWSGFRMSWRERCVRRSTSSRSAPPRGMEHSCFHTHGARCRSSGFFVRTATAIRMPRKRNCNMCSSETAAGFRRNLRHTHIIRAITGNHRSAKNGKTENGRCVETARGNQKRTNSWKRKRHKMPSNRRTEKAPTKGKWTEQHKRKENEQRATKLRHG